MNTLMPALIALHLLAAVVWVGGMFFAYMALRPVAATLLEPPQRLPLWTQTFMRFFPWVWLAILLLTATGYTIVFAVFGGRRLCLIVHRTCRVLGQKKLFIVILLLFLLCLAL